MIILVIGGAKSGKSAFALRRAESFEGRKAYVATAEPLDDEMRLRIDSHRLQRGPDWDTIEVPLKVAEVLDGADGSHGALLIDCLTLWVSNLLMREQDNVDPECEMERFLESLVAVRDRVATAVLIVTNEVGMGIVPDNPLSRRFRDLAGRLNQAVAEVADEVYCVMAGIPLRIK